MGPPRADLPERRARNMHRAVVLAVAACGLCWTVLGQEEPAPYRFEGRLSDLLKKVAIVGDEWVLGAPIVADDLKQHFHPERKPKDVLEGTASDRVPDGGVAYMLLPYWPKDKSKRAAVSIRVHVFGSAEQAAGSFKKPFVNDKERYVPTEFTRPGEAATRNPDAKDLMIFSMAVRVGNVMLVCQSAPGRADHVKFMEAFMDLMGMPRIQKATPP
jgi:hypothetical protein